MTLEHSKHNAGSTAVQLTECPAKGCEREFPEGSGVRRRVHLLNDHTPEDFNL